MTVREVIIALTIHLILPLVGMIYFIVLTKRMKSENLSKSTTYELFIVFITYGGLLLVTLTTIFWKWSGMASVGAIYLILGAPIAMGIIAYKNKKKKDNSIFYNWIYKAGLFYYLIAPVTFLILFLLEDK